MSVERLSPLKTAKCPKWKSPPVNCVFHRARHPEPILNCKFLFSGWLSTLICGRDPLWEEVRQRERRNNPKRKLKLYRKRKANGDGNAIANALCANDNDTAKVRQRIMWNERKVCRSVRVLCFILSFRIRIRSATFYEDARVGYINVNESPLRDTLFDIYCLRWRCWCRKHTLHFWHSNELVRMILSLCELHAGKEQMKDV